MKHPIRRLLALLLTLAMLLALLPVLASAQEPEDLWAKIIAYENAQLRRKRSEKKTLTAADYAALSADIAEMVMASDNYTDGTCTYDGTNAMFFWEDANGEPQGYSPSLRATRSRTANGQPTENVTQTVSYATRGGSPDAKDVYVIGPWYGSDDSFTNQYKTEGQRIAKATGGTYTLYSGSDATISNVAKAMENGAVVIFDSHGVTDYEQDLSYTYPDDTSSYVCDSVTRANTSYLTLTTGTGLTKADKAPVTGTFGTYYHAWSYETGDREKVHCVDGTVIANHMSKDAKNSMLWMAICLGMATTGISAPMRAKGVEVVYGYSQSVTFDGDYAYEKTFWTQMIAGKTVAQAIAAMKSTHANWDPAYYESGNYYNTIDKARKYFVAFPVVVSSEDTHPGQRTSRSYGADTLQTVASSWTLKGGAPSYTLTAVSSNTAYGTVSLSGKTITAAPKTGYQIDDTTPYTVSPAGTATVTRSGNTFTVSNLTSNCTVTIHFAVKVCSHEHTKTERREATCTEGGYERTVCLDCGMELAGMSEPALEHDYQPSVVAPTCTEKGYTLHTCSRCGESYKDAYTDALEHDYVLVASTPSTCTTAGQASYRCTRCGDTYEVALALAAHDYKETVVPPTCTEKGYTLHTCSRCGESYQDAYTDALGHSYKDGKCTVCGEKDPNYQPPVDNTPKYEDFKDLPAGAWYKESVGYALANGLMNGTGDGIFQPDGALTRAMLVTILYRSAGEPSVDGLKNPFQDVADGQWYTKAVVWAAGKGIVNGTSETTFDPDASITREQIAAILHRYAGKPETKGDLASFPDAETVSGYAKTAMAWTVEKGIIGGSDGKLDPRSNATRAQVAAILMRYLKLTENRPL